MERKVYGPYWRKDGRAHVIILTPGKARRTVSYPRYLMEQHLGRILEDWETVDHIDGDPTNNDIPNLQILSRSENISKSAKPRELITFTCPVCGTVATKYANDVKHNRKQGRSGPFCSRKCAGTFSAMRQHHGIELD
ncbi:MAG TPA: HNH endonuclease signature motif containing protein [Nitrososphaera sp.]|jgi:hypothetical protein